MPQSAEKVLDHGKLFHEPEYQASLKAKREFEVGHPMEKVQEVADWTRTWEYREKNFAREALTVNPAKACQPLGAVFAAAGFESTLSFVHGSQGCVAYYRSHLSRHFKEPASCVSSSMTEDAAVFGGLNNMVEGIANAYALYKPKIIAVSTTCMSEVIGEDLQSFTQAAKDKGSAPADFPIPFAHTPAFVGSHITGYDNMLRGVLTYFWDRGGLTRTPNDTVWVIPGFDGYAVGNNRELKRIFALFGDGIKLFNDVSDTYDTPSDGEFRMYDGGTTIDEIKDAFNAKAFVSLQAYNTEKVDEFLRTKEIPTKAAYYPIGVQATDEFVMALAELTGKPVPAELRKERGRLVDALADSMNYLHGKKFCIIGDADQCIGLVRFLLEVGAEPTHVVCTGAPKGWEDKVNAILAASPFGKDCKAWGGKDMWHARSLMATEPVDYILANSHAKYLERDLKIPLIRFGFPIFDRHHHHRQPVIGYVGTINLLTRILDRIFEQLDRETDIPGVTDISFDLVR